MWCKGGLTGDFLSEKSFLLQIAFLSLIGVGAGGPGGPWPWPPHQIWKSVFAVKYFLKIESFGGHEVLKLCFKCSKK